MIRAVLFVGCLLGLTLSSAVAANALAQDEAPADDELPDGARTIIGSPDPGPEPEGPGDRGGWAQLMTLGALTVAVGFIVWRIRRGVRSAPATVSPRDPRRSP